MILSETEHLADSDGELRGRPWHDAKLCHEMVAQMRAQLQWTQTKLHATQEQLAAMQRAKVRSIIFRLFIFGIDYRSSLHRGLRLVTMS